jgi:hypothetical protein
MANTPSLTSDPYFPNTFNNNEARFSELYDADLVNLKESDIGSTVQGYDANTVKSDEVTTISSDFTFSS